MFSFSSIKDYHHTLLNGHTTCVEAVRYYLAAIEQNAHLNAFIEVFADEALERAAYLDKERLEKGITGKLHGVVAGIKDVFNYQHHTASAGSKMLADYKALYNATAVERMLNEGAIIIGRQNCDEFGMGSTNENSAYGKVLNAANEDCVPGGSSGGSAVAVQAGLCMISLGSDTGGSVRQPADFCGVTGFKPSYGSISRHGLIAYASSFDCVGIIAGNVADVQAVFDVIAGADDFDSTSKPIKSLKKAEDKKHFKFCYFKEAIENQGLNAEIRDQFLDFSETLTSAGHTVETIDFQLFDYIVPTYYILTTGEASSNLSRYDGVRFGGQKLTDAENLSSFYKAQRTEGFGTEVKRRIMLGNFVLSAGYYDAYFTKAQQVRSLLKQHSATIFEQFDFIISPTVPSPAYCFNERPENPVAMFLGDIYTVYPNLVGIPAISLPLFKHSSNMPFGLQMMASEANELTLLRFAEQLFRK